MKHRLVTVVAMLALVVGWPSTTDAQVQVPSVDIVVTGEVEQGPESGEVTTGSELRYQITIKNLGPQAVPAGGISLLMLVDRSDSQSNAEMEVARLSSGDLRSDSGPCGRGRHGILRCTNQAEIPVDATVRVTIAHRHPAAVAGQLSFSARVTPSGGAYIDENEDNNGFRGPSYVFAVQPTITVPPSSTTLPPSSTTIAATTSTTDPGSTSTTSAASTTMPSETSSTMNSSTTSTAVNSSTTSSTVDSSTTSTTVNSSAMSTTQPTTTVSTATTVTTASTATVPGAIDGEPAGPDVSLLSRSGDGLQDSGVGLAVAPPADGDDSDDGGSSLLVIVGLLAGLLLLSGAGLAAYLYYTDRDPPLVDIRKF